MIVKLLSIFIVLHGLVHLLYLGQSQRYFELQPGMEWPDHSWIFGKLFPFNTIRSICSSLCAICAILFIAGGIGLFINAGWSGMMISSAGVISSITYLIFWDGTMKRLDNQGEIGVCINIACILMTKLFLS